MSDKATPGPWFHSSTSKWGCVTTQAGGHGHVIAEVGSPPNGNGSLDPVRIAETQANARLIAAAPDLLAALKALTTAREGTPGFNDAFWAALAAIARAEGKS